MRYEIGDLPILGSEIEDLRGDLADRAVAVLLLLNEGQVASALEGAKVWHRDRERLFELLQLEAQLRQRGSDPQ